MSSQRSIYLMILSRSFPDPHLRCEEWLNLELSKMWGYSRGLKKKSKSPLFPGGGGGGGMVTNALSTSHL